MRFDQFLEHGHKLEQDIAAAILQRLPLNQFQRDISRHTNLLRPSANINIVHPFNEAAGSATYRNDFLQPLTHSFDNLRRSEYIAVGGEFEDSQWVACTGYYSGNFLKPWIGIEPTGALAYLRFAEFHCMKNGVAVESYIYLDIPALMMAPMSGR